MAGSEIKLENGKSPENTEEDLTTLTDLSLADDHIEISNDYSHQETNSNVLTEGIKKEIEAISELVVRLFHGADKEEASDGDAVMLINKICNLYNNRNVNVAKDVTLRDCLKKSVDILDQGLKLEVLSDVVENQAIPKKIRQELFMDTVEQLTSHKEEVSNKSLMELYDKICELYNTDHKLVDDLNIKNCLQKTLESLEPDLRITALTDTIDNQRISKRNFQEFFTDVLKILSSEEIPHQLTKDVLSFVDKVSINEVMASFVSVGSQNDVKNYINVMNDIHSLILNSPYLEPETIVRVIIQKINLERFMNLRENSDLFLERSSIVLDVGWLINELPKDFRIKLLKILFKKKNRDKDEDILSDLLFALNKLVVKEKKVEDVEEESEEDDEEDEGKAITSIKWHRNNAIVINYLDFPRRLKILLTATQHNPQEEISDILPYGVLIKTFPINKNVKGDITLMALAEDELDRVSDISHFSIKTPDIQKAPPQKGGLPFFKKKYGY